MKTVHEEAGGYYRNYLLRKLAELEEMTAKMQGAEPPPEEASEEQLDLVRTNRLSLERLRRQLEEELAALDQANTE